MSQGGVSSEESQAADAGSAAAGPIAIARNRFLCSVSRTPNGLERSALTGGRATALEPILRPCGGTRRGRAKSRPGYRKRRRYVAALLPALALLACRPAPEEPSAAIRRVVLISIDTLRADALGSYGNPLEPTPYIDEIAAQGTLFENCIAPSPMTFPSHATMLTGLHPLQHGVLVNMQAKLPAGIATLPQRLGELGWRTGAVVSSTILHRRFDLDRGFDDYRDDFYSALYEISDNSLERTNARETTKQAIQWLEEGTGGDREFLFVHYIDPHAPYDPPPRFAAKFPGNPYVGEIAFVDFQIARLVSFVNETFGNSGTLWIITSDHGEALGEHGENAHGFFLYDEVVRVPLIMAGPGVPPGTVVSEPVGLIDIVPTVLELIGAEPDSRLPGRAIPTTEPDRSFMSTSYISALGFGWSPLWSLSRKDERFILSPDPEYYRTDTDPEEAHNRRAQDAERADKLEKWLRERGAIYLSESFEIEPNALDESSLNQLAALGYMTPSRDSASFALDDFSGRNPTEMYEVVELMTEHTTALQRGDYEAAEEALSAAQRLDPESTAFDDKRGRFLIEAGRVDEFLDWIAEKPEAFQNDPDQRHSRAQALRTLGRLEEAEALLRANVNEDPENLASLYELAAILMIDGQNQNAMQIYARVIELDPRNSSALINYANLLTKSDNPEAAAGHLETLLDFSPDNAVAHKNMGIVYAKLTRFEEAISHLERYQELRPLDDHDPTDRMIEALRQALRFSSRPD